MTVEGRAQPEETLRVASAWAGRELGRTGLSVSSVAMAALGVCEGDPRHRRALQDAWRSGVNLLEVGPAVRGGESARATGHALAESFQRDEVHRAALVMVSRVGRIAGRRWSEVQPKLRGDRSRGVKLGATEGYSLDADAVRGQVADMRDMLGVAMLDGVLLDDPSPALAAMVATGVPLSEARELVHHQLKSGLVALDGLMDDRAIAWYGFAASQTPDVDLEAMLSSLTDDIAVMGIEAGLDRLDAVAPADGSKSFVDRMVEQGRGVLIHQPFVEFAVETRDRGEVEPALSSALAQLRKLEAQWATGLGKRIVDAQGASAVDLFRWGQAIAGFLASSPERADWLAFRHDVMAPHFGQASAVLLKNLTGAARPSFGTWWQHYAAQLSVVDEHVEGWFQSRQDATARRLEGALDRCLPTAWSTATLAQKSIAVLLSAPVSSILVDMCRPEVVHEMAQLRDRDGPLGSEPTQIVDLVAVQAALASDRA